MIAAPSSTWFSTSPDWEWYIVLYFFIGGLAGGSYFISVLIDWFGSTADRRLARLGYYVAFPCVVLSGLLLIADLSRPLRFWHMLVERNTLQPMLKTYSPMSVGSWALLFFGFFTCLSFLAALAEEDRVRPALRRFQWPALRAARPPAVPGNIVSVLGGGSGVFVASYTGVLLSVTNRPIWSDTPLVGMLFVVSAASTSAALLVWLAHRSGWRAQPGVAALQRLDGLVLVLELLVLIALMISLGPALRGWLNAWGVALLGTIALGLVAPLVLSWRHRRSAEADVATMAALVLLGGFFLRVVVVFSSETI